MRPALAPGAAGSPTPDQPAAPAPDCQPKPEPPAQGDAPGGWHPARLDRRPLISLPLLPSPASPSLNRLPRAMRPALAPGAAGSPTPDQPAAPAPDSQPKPEPPAQGDAPVALAPGAAGSPTPDQPAAPALASQPKPEPPAQGDARVRHPARLDRRPLISLPLLLPTARASRLSRCPIIARTPAPCSVRRVPPWQITRSIRRRPSRRRSRAGT